MGCLNKALHIFLFRSKAPDPGHVGAGGDDGFIILSEDRLVVPGVGGTVRAVGRVDVRTFTIQTADIFGFTGSHSGADIGSHLDILFLGHPGVRCHQHGGGTVFQVELGAGDGILPQAVIAAGMGVDIHQTGAYISALGIQNLTGFGDRGRPHFAEAGDLTVLYKQHSLRDQVVFHDQLRMDNRKHSENLLYKYYTINLSMLFVFVK